MKTFRKILYQKEDSLKVEDFTADLLFFADQYEIEFLYNYIKKLDTFVIQESVQEVYILAKAKNDKYLENAVFTFIKKNLKKLEKDEKWNKFLEGHPELSKTCEVLSW